MGAQLQRGGGGGRRNKSGYDLVGKCPAMVDLKRQIAALGPRRCTVVIEGETGTGKELVARQIHMASERSARPFVPVDCTTLQDTLFESQLFGHVKGAFTGAQQSTVGFFRAADGGTLFLDEIAEMPLPLQAKLLRCIQERAVVPLGSVAPIQVDVRIVAATHRNLAALMRCGEFREDLYYRLNIARLEVPPLRKRLDDLEPLVEHILAELAAFYEEPLKSVTPTTMEFLRVYDWPGNVRELSNVLEHGAIFCAGSQLEPSDLPEPLRASVLAGAQETKIMSLEAAERRLISQALRQTNGNQSRAAELLTIERHRLHRKIVRYGLEDLTHPQPQ